MDQNRCLLDVIDNPQLLQSFLESESSIDTNNRTNAVPILVSSIQTTPTPTTTTTTTTTIPTSNVPTTPILPENPSTDTTPADVKSSEPEIQNQPDEGLLGEIQPNQVQTLPDRIDILNQNDQTYSVQSEPMAQDVQISESQPSPPTISSAPSTTTDTSQSTIEQNTNEQISFTPQQDQENAQIISEVQTNPSPSAVQSTPTAALSNMDQRQNAETSQVTQQPSTLGTQPNPNPNSNPSPIQETQPNKTTISPTTPITTTTITKTTTTTTSNVKNQSPQVTPAPTKKSTPRSKAKNKKDNSNNSNTQSPVTTMPQPQKTLVSGQYSSSPAQQQLVFQSNNNGIRQATVLGSPAIGQGMVGIPQQQRVIQIQTANGPMYFAIAPGPPVNNNSMMNPQQQQQQPGMQSQQYPSQQICFQQNSTVMMSRPQLGPNLQQPQQHQQAQTQQQVISSQANNIVVNGQQLIQSNQTHQPRLAAPIMAGQTLAIQNPQNSQQQNVVLSSTSTPSSQPMMMPRISNQIILNRPLNNPGPMMPGQQQFIQILTPNGPMLLALPTQTSQQQALNSNNNSSNNNNNNNINNNASNNSPMIDYKNQVQTSLAQPSHQMQVNNMSSQQQPTQVQTPGVTNQSQTTQQKPASTPKTVSGTKSGLDLADLLLDCGILPEERTTATQSPSSVKTSQSPSIQQINSSISNAPQMNSPLPQLESSSMSNNPVQQPITNAYTGQPLQQQQPIRITFGPDGQMMMQPTIYGAIRPVMTNTMGQPHLNAAIPNNVMSASSPMMTITSAPTTPNSTESVADSNKKPNARGKGTAVKRSRSKKSDIDKFPILKTPKIAQQQQQQQQQLQAVTVVPMTMLVGDQNKVLTGADVKPNLTQLAGGQQMSLTKIVTPVMQTASLNTSVNSNLVPVSIPTTNMLATRIGQNQNSISSAQNTQLGADSANSINSSSVNSSSTAIVESTNSHSATQISSSGNVTSNSLQRFNIKPGTVESNPHISSSLMPTISLTVDNIKIEHNGLKTLDGLTNQNLKTVQANCGLTTTTTLVLQHPNQAQHQQNIQNSHGQSNPMLQQQQMARQVDIRAQSILNQMLADQNAALNPQIKQSFKSIEDACKRLLRYHVFDTETVSVAQIKKVDDIFQAAVESLISRKKAIYNKYRLLILKQSMKIVPSSEEVMLDQVFVNDELAYIKKERELFRDYEAHMESVAENQTRPDSKTESNKDDCAEYFAFGNNSPKHNNQNDLDNAAHSRDVDEWLMADKWGESRYPSVPDSEAATAIESILNEELT